MQQNFTFQNCDIMMQWK